MIFAMTPVLHAAPYNCIAQSQYLRAPSTASAVAGKELSKALEPAKFSSAGAQKQGLLKSPGIVKHEVNANGYKFLVNPYYRDAMIKGIIEILKQARRKRIKTVFVTGVSAGPVAQFFRLCWERFYPEEPLPSFVFLNSAGRIGWGGFKEKGVRAEIETSSRKAVEPFLLLDDIYITGQTLYRVKNILMQRFKTRKVYTAGLFFGERKFDDDTGWDDHDDNPMYPVDITGFKISANAAEIYYRPCCSWYMVRSWINKRTDKYGLEPPYDVAQRYDKTRRQERLIFDEYLPHDLGLLAREAEIVFNKKQPSISSILVAMDSAA